MPPSRGHSPDPGRSPQKFAVLIDGSALFLAVRSIGIEDDRKLNYFALIEALCNDARLQGLRPAGEGSESLWAMWTAADPRNQGQEKFLEFAEQRLRWQVRRTAPSKAFMVEPSALYGVGGPSEPAKSHRLMRFDASIAFAMGRLADERKLVLVSDSYALREPMARVNEHGGDCSLAFFRHALDSRWLADLGLHAKRDAVADRFMDLDAHAASLFGTHEKEVARAVTENSKPWY